MARNTQKIIDLLRDARGGGVPLEHLSALLGVSRPTLYKWREIGEHIPEGVSAAEWASQTTSEGHALHYKGTNRL